MPPGPFFSPLLVIYLGSSSNELPDLILIGTGPMETLLALLYHFFFVVRLFWQLSESYRRKQKGRAIRGNGGVLKDISERDEVSPFFGLRRSQKFVYLL
jgi:hypothetical protein